MAVLFLFVDGVGAGAPDPAVNPLARHDWLLSRFLDGTGSELPRRGRASLVDACLGVEGRPQSATGQATLLTGENAAAALGRHLVGFPNAPLRDLIDRHSLFRRLGGDGLRVDFANSYPVAYLRALGIACEGTPEFVFPPGRRARPSATTVAYRAGPGRFRTFADARAGRGLTHDITGARAAGVGVTLPRREPEEAAEILVSIAAGADLTLFEFFESDEAGHAQSMERAEEVLGRVDRLLRALVASLPGDLALVVTSDHGNVEDLSLRGHTRHAVPLLGFGAAAGRVEAVRDLTGVAPLLRELASGTSALPEERVAG